MISCLWKISVSELFIFYYQAREVMVHILLILTIIKINFSIIYLETLIKADLGWPMIHEGHFTHVATILKFNKYLLLTHHLQIYKTMQSKLLMKIYQQLFTLFLFLSFTYNEKIIVKNLLRQWFHTLE